LNIYKYFVSLQFKAEQCVIRVIKLRRMRWAETVARMVETMKAYKIFVGKPEGKV